MQIETVLIDEPQLDPDNARVHPAENLAAIKESLQRFGQVVPIVLRGDTVVGGNGTLMAMRELGHEEVRVVRFEGTEAEAKKLAIALNRTAELASWDAEVLGRQLTELSKDGVDPVAVGFDVADLEELFPDAPDVDFRTVQPELGGEKKKTKEKPVKAPVIQYALIFDDEEQQKRFFSCLRKLKEMFPDAKTNAARLDEVVREILS
jgi:hypothetical protein